MTLEEKLSALSDIVEDTIRGSARMYEEFAQAAQARGDLAAATHWHAAAAGRWEHARAVAAGR